MASRTRLAEASQTRLWAFRAAATGGSGVFADGGQSLGDHRSRSVSLGDLDGDGDLDAFVANALGGNRVWGNQDPPRVADVLVSGTAWSPAFLDQLESAGAGGTHGHAIPVGSSAQLDTVNWVNADQIIIRFSVQVNIDEADLVLSGVLGPDGVEDAADDYSFSNFITETGPTGEFQAVWTLAAPLAIDKLLIHLDGTTAAAVTSPSGIKLDGEWLDTTSTYPSGEGTAGGDFELRFNVLPGDADDSDTVDALDAAQVDATFICFPGFSAYSIFNDLNGDGFVVSNDVLFTRARSGDTLPAAEPAAQAPAPAAASSAVTSAATALSATSQSPADGATPDVLATAVPLRDRAGRLSRFGASRTDRPAGLGTRVNVRRLHDRGARPNLIERLAARRMPRSFLSSLDAARRTANESLLEDLLSIP